MNLPADNGCLIIGYGSPLRGDDAVGLHAARILARHGYHALAMHQLNPELAEAIARAPVVVFVDADATLAPGEVAVERIGTTSSRRGAMEHYSAPEALLALARDLYAATPESWRVGIGTADFSLGHPLSPAARTGLRRAVAEVTGRTTPAV